LGYAIIWEFLVPAERAAAFELAYGPDGPWAKLFARGKGFTELILLKCERGCDRYMTIDRWDSAASFDDFKQEYASEYRALDIELEGLAHTETRLGGFNHPQ
jgi:heme-degrading monooxygenase HmoA